MSTNRRVAAKKVLEAAKKFASKDVVVVSKDRAGALYLATSMPSGCSQHLDAQVKLLEEALKTLRRYRTTEQRREKANGQEGAH